MNRVGGRHAHSHGDLPEASRRTRRIVAAVLIPAALVTLIAMLVMWPGRVDLPGGTSGGERVLGTVTAVAATSATVQVDNGPVTTVDLPQGPGAVTLADGDEVVLLHFPGAVPGGPDYTVVDHQRGGGLTWLLALTVAVILVFGRWRGLTSLAGLAISFAVLLFFIIPAILEGSPPLLVAVVGASAIMFAALYLTHGVTVHTSVAVAGTLASLIVTGLLGAAFTAALHLTGVANDDDSFLSVTQGSIDMRGLLLAGIIIGALGVLDDVTVTQATTVAEMAQAGGTTCWGLYRAAIRIGRAHVASAVNTIVLAYAGTSLPLLLLIAAGPQPVGELLTSEFLSQEILRSAVGTIGLVASVPITTALATLVAEISVNGRHRLPQP
ncbi:YibE/F family protein [Actinoplanes sp. LDG1-06]|uniref:YibE/F family protein n=1 Tax=Paractinoplanes ovalisporus TaxID=2810368 RepID=A0ABS2ACS8_9ACTN|nr:YibE/F family protein [Actinoplanes ovalisporus]MBM2617061.1 YibE/F family protein [Actinoplanes ovalisporus]